MVFWFCCYWLLPCVSHIESLRLYFVSFRYLYILCKQSMFIFIIATRNLRVFHVYSVLSCWYTHTHSLTHSFTLIFSYNIRMIWKQNRISNEKIMFLPFPLCFFSPPLFWLYMCRIRNEEPEFVCISEFLNMTLNAGAFNKKTNS